MILAAVDDLLFSSKIRSAAERAGRAVRFVRSRDEIVPAILADRPALVILDLDRVSLDPVSAIRAVRADESIRDVPIVAFVRHTNTELIRSAREAGATSVLARSAFFPALYDLMAT